MPFENTLANVLAIYAVVSYIPGFFVAKHWNPPPKDHEGEVQKGIRQMQIVTHCLFSPLTVAAWCVMVVATIAVAITTNEENVDRR